MRTTLMKKGLLIILSGPSGVGKGTVRLKLMTRPELNLFYSVSMTTRKIRPGEKEGREYYYVSRQEFLKQVEEGNLLEWNEFVGNLYGTPLDKVNQKREEGYNVLLEIDVNGAMKVMEKCPDAVSIFLKAPSFEALEKRIRGRSTETEEVIKERLGKAKSEYGLAYKYKYSVINDSVERAADEIASIIKKESKQANLI